MNNLRQSKASSTNTQSADTTQNSLKNTDSQSFLVQIHPSGDVFKIRSVKCPNQSGSTFLTADGGCFDNFKDAVAAVANLEQREPSTIFVTLDSAEPDLASENAVQLPE
jgi:hypothetical protein